MHGIAPLNIITDQDQAMKNSIANMFPHAVHRSCHWHIIKKAQEKLGAYLARHPELAKELNEVIDLSMTPEEFEARWAAMVEKHGIVGDKRFDDLYVSSYSSNRLNGVKASMLS